MSDLGQGKCLGRLSQFAHLDFMIVFFHAVTIRLGKCSKYLSQPLTIHSSLCLRAFCEHLS